MSAGNGHVCPSCGSWVGPGMGHVCSFIVPNQPPSSIPLVPMNAACRAPWIPISLDDIRKVIREELERSKATDPTSLPVTSEKTP